MTVLDAFVQTFVLPLLGGGEVLVGRPIRPRERDLMAGELSRLTRTPLSFMRLRRAEEFTPHPILPDPDDGELSLWIGLHNTLAFDHPDRGRVWARASTWRRVEGSTRTMLTLPTPTELSLGLARHVSVGAFIELRRLDTVVTSTAGEIRYLGQGLPRRRLAFGLPTLTTGREETVVWLHRTHASETLRLIEDALRASPLTCLLHPLRAPQGWSPLLASGFLQERGYARSICHRWAAHKDWISTGGAVMSALMPSLPHKHEPPPPDAHQEGPLALSGTILPSSPRDVGAVVAALVHLHFLKVLEFDARLGVALGSRDPGIAWFLALPLLLPVLGEHLGDPLGGLRVPSRGSGNPTEGFEAQAHRCWTEYIDHLRELVPRIVVENLLASLVPAIVGTT